jgi:prolyl-tRNA synthetase
MMDAYSFSATEDGMNEYYLLIREALTELLDCLNLDYAFVAADSGDIGGSVSEELMVFSDIGGDVVWTDESGQSANEEVADQITWVGEVKKRKAIEVGHIFQLGTKYSEAMDLKWDSAEGRRTVHMGCYGIGTSRLIAAYVQQNHDTNGLIWNEQLSAYDFHILQLGNNDIVSNLSNRLEKHLVSKKYSVLVDDRKKVKNGAKFAEADILGLSKQIIIGKQNAENDMVEIKDRRTGKRVVVSIHDVINELNK